MILGCKSFFGRDVISALSLSFVCYGWRVTAYVTVANLFLWPSLINAQTFGPNILPAGNFENVQAIYVPWAGVDDNGNIHGLEGQQISVGDDGGIRGSNFGPSVAVADLRGSGKQDLMLADSKGFFWYYTNSGTPQSPVFTQGEVIPIWLGEASDAPREGIDNVVPRIQLVDFNGLKKLDVVAGTYAGKLFHIPNIGSSSQPNFKPTVNRDSLLINTRRRGVLWSNYLAPCMTLLFSSSNMMDLIVGEGTYSANSLFLLRNTGSNEEPSFDEDHTQKIIPGMGREQLTPVVVDWNNDGKADVLCGDRTGFINLFLNNSTDPSNPTFTPGTHIKIGGVEKLGGSITVAIGDLTGNHLPNLLIGRDDGLILYAQNTGKLGSPAFDIPATPLKGVLPPTYHYVALNDWHKDGAWGAPDELLCASNPQIDPGFAFPKGETSKYALKFFVWPVKNVFFEDRYYPPIENDCNEHVIGCSQGFTLGLNKTYRIHFWVKGDRNPADFRYRFIAAGVERDGFHGYDVINPISAGTTWSEVSDEIRIENHDDKTVTEWGYGLEFRFKGQTTFYIDDIQIQEEL